MEGNKVQLGRLTRQYLPASRSAFISLASLTPLLFRTPSLFINFLSIRFEIVPSPRCLSTAHTSLHQSSSLTSYLGIGCLSASVCLSSSMGLSASLSCHFEHIVCLLCFVKHTSPSSSVLCFNQPTRGLEKEIQTGSKTEILFSLLPPSQPSLPLSFDLPSFLPSFTHSRRP
mmetsp:Transcript_23205/g.45659  ORF Transcript_23205/g.45659 Transcript_23205/m.45659 type:complete len:172 (-) Transcript_23205:226-741(-)